MNKSRRITQVFAAPFLLWAVIFIFIPLLFIAWYGTTDGNGAFTTANLSVIFHWEYLKSLELSIFLGLVSTLACLVIAYPVCLILTEKKRGKSPLIFVLFILPMWMNSLLTTMAWQTLLEKTALSINSYASCRYRMWHLSIRLLPSSVA